MNRKKWTKKALVLSICLFVLWWILGVSATLAWFVDETEPVRNSFIIGEINLAVSYKTEPAGTYMPLDGATEVFGDEALYEPGYTQVVYLKIENQGNIDFDYKMAVTVNKYEKAKSVIGTDIVLPLYLKFGAVFAETEQELLEKVETRLDSWICATANMEDYMLNTWSENSEYTCEVEDTHYAALIVYMPTEVDNHANYRGAQPPTVELGISVYAQQAGTPMN